MKEAGGHFENKCSCGRSFRTKQGLGLHFKKCPLRNPKTFFLNEQHEEHVTKGQARRQRELRKKLEEMGTPELFAEALKLLQKNTIRLERLEKQVAQLAASINAHLTLLKQQK